MAALPVLDRLAEGIEITEAGCWEWTKARTAAGYGRCADKYTHRLMWEEVVGPIPEGLEIDHLCRNRACCNPDHLEPVTHAENMARAPYTAATIKRDATECSNGHPYTPDTLRWAAAGKGMPRKRVCRICRNAAARRYNQRRKALGQN